MSVEEPENEKPVDDGDTLIHEEERTIIRSTNESAKAPLEASEAADIQGPRLEVFSGPLSGQKFALAIEEGGSFVLGRGSECQVVLDDGSVSRNHVQITRFGKVHYISDLGSSNGTLVDGQLILKDHPLQNNAEIKVGVYNFIFQDPDLGDEDVPSQLPVPYSSQVPSKPAIDLGSEEDEVSDRPRSLPLLVGFVALVLFCGLILTIGVRKILTEDTFNLSEVWTQLFGPSTGPQLAYPLLEVRTSPIPGKVFFQGDFLGEAPVEKKFLDGVMPGTELEVRAEFDLKQLEEQVVVKKMITFSRDQEISSHLLEGNIGQIHVRKLPRGTDVLLEYRPFYLTNEDPTKISKPEIDYKEPIYSPFGEYKFELRLEEKFRYRRKFIVDTSNPRMVFELTEDDLTFAPITIVTNPPEAEIILDGQLLPFKTPLRDFRLAHGNHTILLRKENYQEFLLEELPNPLEVNEPLLFKIDLPISGVGEMILQAKKLYQEGLYKQTETTLFKALKNQPPPTGLEKAEIQLWLASVYLKLKDYRQALIYNRKAKDFVDDEGEQPFFQRGKLGEARVYLAQKKENQALRYTVEVFFATDDDPLTKSVADEIFKKISPTYSVLYIDTVPSGASVFFRGKLIQDRKGRDAKTPLMIPKIPAGAYPITIVKEGYEDYKETVRFTLSELKPLKPKLVPR